MDESKAAEFSIPHACGGEPFRVLKGKRMEEYSPRVWG